MRWLDAQEGIFSAQSFAAAFAGVEFASVAALLAELVALSVLAHLPFGALVREKR